MDLDNILQLFCGDEKIKIIYQNNQYKQTCIYNGLRKDVYNFRFDADYLKHNVFLIFASDDIINIVFE